MSFDATLQAAYSAAVNYSDRLRKLGKNRGNRPIYESDIRALQASYNQLIAAQWSLNAEVGIKPRYGGDSPLI
jgi:hypothetical protein